MSVGEWLSEEMEGLKQIRDELMVQAELGRAELRDQMNAVEKNWHELEGKLKLLRESARDDAGEVREAAKLLAGEIRKSYEHLRSRV